MKKLIVTIALSMFLLILFNSCGGSTPEITTETNQTETAKTLTPIKIAEWSGTGTKKTELFNINSDIWAVSWAFQPDYHANLLIIEIVKPAYYWYH